MNKYKQFFFKLKEKEIKITKTKEKSRNGLAIKQK
jgi:hypothetical protein